ncbi:uncharacterized protein LOC141906135 [Tubulanus polymorphus]|uniref:uncharacterized protein LOC141906135 n=1 Tax=Tubulanus polymorphus TaxID=672921 RepID=UPI003DA47902
MSNGASSSVRGALRSGGNRSPPFVVIGLVVVICILGFNYWNVSSKNRRFVQEIGELHDKFRLLAIKKISLEKRNQLLIEKNAAHKQQLSKNFALLSDHEKNLGVRDSEMKQKSDELMQCKEKEATCQKQLFDVIHRNGPTPVKVIADRPDADAIADKQAEEFKIAHHQEMNNEKRAVSIDQPNEPDKTYKSSNQTKTLKNVDSSDKNGMSDAEVENHGMSDTEVVDDEDENKPVRKDKKPSSPAEKPGKAEQSEKSRYKNDDDPDTKVKPNVRKPDVSRGVIKAEKLQLGGIKTERHEKTFEETGVRIDKKSKNTNTKINDESHNLPPKDAVAKEDQKQSDRSQKKDAEREPHKKETYERMKIRKGNNVDGKSNAKAGKYNAAGLREKESSKYKGNNAEPEKLRYKMRNE